MTDTRAAYEAFCQENGARLPIFAQSWYLDAVCANGRWDAAIAKVQGRVQAVLPYFMKRRWGFCYLTMPPFVKYLGPYFADAPDLTTQHRLLEQLIAQLPRVDAFQQNFHPDFTNWLPFYWAGFRQTTRYTYRLQLDDVDQVFANVNRNLRRNIAKADSQLRLVLKTTPEEFYDINRLSFQRQGLKMPYSLAQFLQHDAALTRHAARQFFLAQDASGRTHSAAYLIWDAHSAYYHLSGDDPALRASGAGIWLVWQSIRFTKETLGLPMFDFEGSMLSGVEAIRRQFGAVQTPYFYVWKYNSLLYKLAKVVKNS